MASSTTDAASLELRKISTMSIGLTDLRQLTPDKFAVDVLAGNARIDRDDAIALIPAGTSSRRNWRGRDYRSATSAIVRASLSNLEMSSSLVSGMLLSPCQPNASGRRLYPIG
jgi:hypothetical protein